MYFEKMSIEIEDDGKVFVTFVVINKTNPSTEKRTFIQDCG